MRGSMSLKRMVVSGSALLLISMVGLSAAKSDVADAVMKGDKAAVRALLGQRADVNAPQADGATALHWAGYRGPVDAANVRFAAGPTRKAVSGEGAPPLWLAGTNGEPPMRAALLKPGADPNEQLPFGKTDLML